MKLFGNKSKTEENEKFGASSTAEDVTAGVDAKALTAVVTGGASGIGAETVRILAKRGAEVVIAARNMVAAEETRRNVLKETPEARIRCIALDLSSLASVKQFADEFLATDLPLNILINNAGIMFCPFTLSKDRIELQFATNHVSHFYLTNLLLDRMKKSAEESGIEGRIVNLSSVAHKNTYSEGIRSSAITSATGYEKVAAYGQSKLANIVHAMELSEKMKSEGVKIIANSVHPGLIATPLWRHSKVMKLIVKVMMREKWKSIEEGAATTCYVALNEQVKGVSGKYFQDCHISHKLGKHVNDDVAKKVWSLTEELISTSLYTSSSNSSSTSA